MSTKSSKPKKLRGFASVISHLLEPVNNKERFKDRFKDYNNFRLLLNAKDAKYAALIIVDKATLKVEGLRNDDKAVLKKLKKECDGFLEMSTNLFLDLAMGKLSKGAMAKKAATRKIKVKGMKNVVILSKLFYYTTDEVK